MAADDNMVLRTISLPREIDLQLKSLASTFGVSKGEMTRHLIDRGLADLGKSVKRALVKRLNEAGQSEPNEVSEPGESQENEVILAGMKSGD